MGAEACSSAVFGDIVRMLREALCGISVALRDTLNSPMDEKFWSSVEALLMANSASGLASLDAEQLSSSTKHGQIESRFLARAVCRSVAALRGWTLEDQGYPSAELKVDPMSMRPGRADIAVLLRQLLGIARRSGSRTLRVSADMAAMAESLLAQSGVAIESKGFAVARLRLVDDTIIDGIPDQLGVIRPEMRRIRRSVPGDGALRRIGLKDYASERQREAVMAVFAAPPRSVILVSLPTGGGKSLCHQLPAHFWSGGGDRAGGTTLVVVPTVALALDQVRASQCLFAKNPYACAEIIGDTPDSARKAVFESIRRGETPLVFMSPEMVLGPAGRMAIEESAREGHLRALVIDEAHLITSWGVKFRPDLQRIARFRRHLAELDPRIVTVLLSATATPAAIDRLRARYTEKGDVFRHIDGQALRQEHDFVSVSVPDPRQRSEIVARMLHRLPRPVLMYTTRVEDANSLFGELRERGFLRSAVFTGQTGRADRKQVIDDWRADRLDLVVATSAFGLGIDKPDVRVVVHATIPESLDRLYQEVGRSGRDGFAATSICVQAAGDMELARRNSLTSLLTSILAAKRVLSMLEERVDEPPMESGERLYRVKLDDVADHVAERNQPSGRTNREWNAAALLLLERAGILAVVRIEDDFDDSGKLWWTIRLDRPEVCSTVEELSAAIEPMRSSEQQTNIAELERLARAVDPGTEICMHALLAQTYGLADVGDCGRCNACRSMGRPSASQVHIEPLAGRWANSPARTRTLGHRLRRVLGEMRYRRAAIALTEAPQSPKGDLSRGVSRLLRALAEDGVDLFVVPDHMVESVLSVVWEERDSIGSVRPWSSLRTFGRGQIERFGTALLLTPRLGEEQEVEFRARQVNELVGSAAIPFAVFVAPSHLRLPQQPDRRWLDSVASARCFDASEYLEAPL